MEKFLIDFLEHPQNVMKDSGDKAGPVITISRECGCSANQIAIKLSKILSGYSYQSDKKQARDWKWVNKEVIEKAAEELDMSPEKIKEVFRQEARLSLHKVQTAFSTEKMYDADDQQVIDTLSDIIKSLANNGNCIIVGRAANVLANDITRKLRVKLQAPKEWRINRIRHRSSLSFSEAEEYVDEIDRQRELFVEHIAGHHLDNNDFDVIFNYSTLNDDQIVDAILHLMKTKALI